MTFAENLKRLPSIEHLAALELFDGNGKLIATIENKPGKAGSLAVYAHLAQRHSRIDAAAAQEGLGLFAEHTADARANPGKHPNIDRLCEVASGADSYRARLVPKTTA